MGTISKGYTFGSTEQVTSAKLHALVDSATITGITNADIDSTAAIATSKLAAIAGSNLTTLDTISVGAGVIPAANLTSVAQKGANSDITSLTVLTSLPTSGNLAIVIENRTDDTGCTQTGRLWLRTDL
jgi:hypothetical protein